MYSLEDIRKFIASYHPKGIIVDTNILILFLVGKFDPEYIKKFKPLTNSNKDYSIEDFQLLEKILSAFPKIIITPQILAELSNLSITKGALCGDDFIKYLKTVIDFIKQAEEHHHECKLILGMGLEVISEFGLPDMTMFGLSRQTKMPIITNDQEFYHYSSKQIPIIRFEFLRERYRELQSALQS